MAVQSENDDHLLIALRHRLRREILRRMIGREKVSPRELSDEMDEPLSNVSYHMRVLKDTDSVVLVDARPVRGSMQHFYRVVIDEPWALAALELPAEPDGDQDPNGATEADDA